MSKRKRKTTGDENMGNKTKNKRYRRGCVADEVPSTIKLDNDDDEEEEEEEPGEIVDDIDEQQQQLKSFQPFKYEPIDEDKFFSNSKIFILIISIWKIEFLLKRSDFDNYYFNR